MFQIDLTVSSITKERTEVIFQGTQSLDPKDPEAVWEEYQFLCKPGDVYQRPCLISPYHYRLDWLMWFAAFQVKFWSTQIYLYSATSQITQGTFDYRYLWITLRKILATDAGALLWSTAICLDSLRKMILFLWTPWFTQDRWKMNPSKCLSCLKQDVIFTQKQSKTQFTTHADVVKNKK